MFDAKSTTEGLFGRGIASPRSVFGGDAASSAPGDDDVVFVSENRPDSKMMEEARRHQLPEGFYLYETRKPCKGCIGE